MIVPSMPTEEINTREVQIGCLLNEIMDRRARGDVESVEKLLKEHPDLAEEVRGHLQLLGGADDVIPVNLLGVGDASSSVAPDSIPGYELVREIHRGGQGVVYEALQLSMDRRTVALKVLLEGPFASERHRWMFEREVKLVAALEHPNIVVIYDSGITQGKYYFAMKYLSGKPLDTHVRIAQLSTRQIVTLLKKICDAVAYAHRRGVIHRDLKPLNVLVGDEGQPCILDFGMAKVLGGDLRLSRPHFVSQIGDRMGTLQYMSPEQTLGEPEKIDMRTDIYSFGVIMYELLTGRRVHDLPRDLSTAFSLIRDQDPPKPSRIRTSLNSEIDAIVMKALEKDPERRYQSASELAEDLDAWLDGRPIVAKSASSLYVIRKLAARHSFETLVILAMLLGLGSFGTLAMQSYWHERQALARAAQSDRAKVDADWQIAQRVYGSNLPDERRLKLGWFLLEWHANRTDRAKVWQASLRAGSPEHAAIAFLLDDSTTLAQLMAQLAPQERPLAYFVAGERAFKSGQVQQAIEYLEQSMRTPGDGWIKGTVQARLDLLRPTNAKQNPSASTASQ